MSRWMHHGAETQILLAHSDSFTQEYVINNNSSDTVNLATPSFVKNTFTFCYVSKPICDTVPDWLRVI